MPRSSNDNKQLALKKFSEGLQQVESAMDIFAKYAKPIVHVCYIPAVIAVGMLFTKPQPSLGQLFFMA